MKDISRKLLYADDLAIVAEDKEELNERRAEWKEAVKQHGLRVNLEKTEVLSIGAHREELNIKLEGRTIRQNNSFIYLGGAVSSDGRSETELRRRVQAEANAWRQVEGVMSDRQISKSQIFTKLQLLKVSLLIKFYDRVKIIISCNLFVFICSWKCSQKTSNAGYLMCLNQILNNTVV